MKIISISVTHGFTANVGNYNSTRFEVGQTAHIEDGDDPAECLRSLDREVGAYVAAKRKALNDYLKAKEDRANA